MRSIDLTSCTWRKSNYSNGDGGACVEVSDDFPAHIPVRDSKCPEGGALIFGEAAWAAFTASV
ncbi:DUF397 domain-containing protein [Streptomyces sp. NPDC093252]|uniref:DUF397 domain-containing protein n=1 Tax=Streptomyces sp. NPDC093252 TaxID=3154980 RepID=UPI00342AD460